MQCTSKNYHFNGKVNKKGDMFIYIKAVQTMHFHDLHVHKPFNV